MRFILAQTGENMYRAIIKYNENSVVRLGPLRRGIVGQLTGST